MTSTSIDWPNAADKFLGQHIRQQSRRNDLSLRHQHAVAEAGRNLFDVVGDQDQCGRVGIGGQIGQSRHQLLAAAQGPARRRARRAAAVRDRHQGAGDQDPLALALGQRLVACGRLDARRPGSPACRRRGGSRRLRSAPATGPAPRSRPRRPDRGPPRSPECVAPAPRNSSPTRERSSDMSTRPSRSPST